MKFYYKEKKKKKNIFDFYFFLQKVFSQVSYFLASKFFRKHILRSFISKKQSPNKHFNPTLFIHLKLSKIFQKIKNIQRILNYSNYNLKFFPNISRKHKCKLLLTTKP